jgi:ankyrin repeat protein
MLKYNEYITEATNSTEHPFIQAAKRCSNEVVKKSIKNGINIDTISLKDGRTALMNAALNSCLMTVNILVDAGANVNLQDKDGRTALMMASTNKIIDKLLKAGTNVNILNYYGETVAMENLRYNSYNSVSILEKLLKYGIDLDIKDKGGRNFYELIKNKLTFAPNNNEYIALEKYMDENFPKYKEEWDLKQNVQKYNL